MAAGNASSSHASGLGLYKSFDKNSSGIEMRYTGGWVKLTALKPGIIHVQAGPSDSKPSSKSFAVLPSSRKKPDVNCDESIDSITMRTASLQVRVTKNPFRLDFLNAKGQVLTGGTQGLNIDWDGKGITSRHISEQDEHFFGFGLQFHSLDQRGKTRILKINADTPVDNGMAHAVTPFFISTKGYGIFLDSTGYTEFHMASVNPNEYSFKSPDRVLDYYFIYGPEPKKVVTGYTDLTGRAFMPPKWGLGFWYRMHHQWNAVKTQEIAEAFRKEQIPCDVIGLEPGWQTHSYSCSYVWNKDNFPNPPEYVDWMRDRGFRLNLWEHAYVHPSSPIHNELKAANCVGDKEVWGGLVPDFTFPEAARIFTDYHRKELVELGISGFKLDECDGSDFTGGWFFPDDTKFPSGLTGAQMHNLYGFLYQKTMYEMYERLGQRTYQLVRANYAGAQRYPSCIYSDYYGLDQYIRASVNSGFSGVLWCPEVRQTGSDEDFIRRSQVMFFSPLAMINAWADGVTPWEKGPEVQRIFKKYADLRMQLIPYVYSSFWQARKTGIPLMRALLMDYPDDKATYKVDDEFMFGDAMLVAPVISGTSREVYLPKGRWIDFWTGKVYEGGSRINFEASLECLPIFVKEGSIIPMYPVMNYVGEKQVDEIEFHVYPGSSETAYTLYEDDGETTGYLKGQNATVKVECETQGNTIDLKLGAPKGEYTIPFKSGLFSVHIPDGRGVKSVRVNGKVVSDVWNMDDGILHVKVPFGENIRIRIDIQD
ncbi:MAG: glycoside hydrolase family 31 protein [Armatimonadota bacterium]